MLAVRSLQACGSAVAHPSSALTLRASRRRTWLSIARTQSAATNAPQSDFSENSGTGTTDDSTHSESFMRREVLDLALQQVHQHGWTRRALVEAAAQLQEKRSSADTSGTPSLSISGLFEPDELVHILMQRWNDRLRDDLQRAVTEPLAALTTPHQRAVYAIQTRLGYLTDYVESQTWPSAMALGAQPTQMFTTQERLRETMDIVAAFVATDPPSAADDAAAAAVNPPSNLSEPQMALLGGVYVATELHLLTDAPPYSDTWDFLERRVHEWDVWVGASSSSTPVFEGSSLSPLEVLDVARAVSTAAASGVLSVVVPSALAMAGSSAGAFRSASTTPDLSQLSGLLPRPPRTLPTLPVLGDPPQPLADLWSVVFGNDDDGTVGNGVPMMGTDPRHYAAPRETEDSAPNGVR